MKEHRITEKMISRFAAHLHTEERSMETKTKYLHELRAFQAWLGDLAVTKEKVVEWKEKLRQSGKAAVTVNGALAALHSFFAMLGWHECRVKYLKVQRKMFRDSSRDLNRDEFGRLVCAARAADNERLALLLETICGTGVRVSEVKYLTVEALKCGRAEVDLKGKIRTILVPGKLAKKLLKYCQKQKITSGEIFITARGTGMSRRQIWGEMKRLCRAAGVDASKVFPHNLRHLFARAYYRVCRDIVELADVLGHSSIETTRIYLITTGAEHARRLDQLGLVS
ncbi:tyrosine-type recombinase/integrase [Beduinella massiliensis]|uniref:tyrosine-type recombinase/integrase n=1 Tax=Beduinella massiliensis TaxID=1852363 RepID=UPI000C826CC9